ncbi:Hypothetical protein I5071_9660 [Sandaracinus amylolyticus]|nr:Hypothetical protein I5071_9660 [Sandaracinus amylolyticus]
MTLGTKAFALHHCEYVAIASATRLGRLWVLATECGQSTRALLLGARLLVRELGISKTRLTLFTSCSKCGLSLFLACCQVQLSLLTLFLHVEASALLIVLNGFTLLSASNTKALLSTLL